MEHTDTNTGVQGVVLRDKYITLLSAWWWSKLEGRMAHQAHHGLRRVKLLGHQRLGARRRRRGGLPHSTSAAPRPSVRPVAAILIAAAAAVVVLVLVVWVGAGAIAATPVSAAAAISVSRGRGWGGPLAVAAASTAAVSAVAAAAASAVLGTPTHRTHPPVALVLVHQVGVVGVGAATETGTATWK